MRGPVPARRAIRQLLLAAATGVAGATAGAQTLAANVERAPDGVVRMQVRSRAGVCGDGRELVGYRSAIFARNFQSIGGRWQSSECVPGDLRVTVYKVDGQVNRIRTEVGGPWARTEQRVTDVGVVAAAEASAYIFSLVPRVERGSGDRLLIPAVLADVEPPIQPLLALAANDERRMATRRDAIQWVGLLGDASVVPALTRFARGDQDGLGSSALAALSMLESDAGVPALIELAGSGDTETRRNALFWLGQNDDPRGRRVLLGVIEDAAEPRSLREHAVFSLSQRKEDAALEALMRIAREDKDTYIRGKALFWLGQKDDPRARQLIADIILRQP
jgi:hypothetical protein